MLHMIVWNSWDQFFLMGGYAFYVWSSVLCTCTLLGLELWGLRRARAHVLIDLRHQGELHETENLGVQ